MHYGEHNNVYTPIPIITIVLFKILYYGKAKISIMQLLSLTFLIIISIHRAECGSKYRHISSRYRLKKLNTSVVSSLIVYCTMLYELGLFNT